MKQIVISLVLANMLFTSCTNTRVSSDDDELFDSHKWGKVIRQEIVASDFTSIDLSEDFDVVYRQAESPSVVIEGNENVVAYHHVEIVDGTLVDHKTEDAPKRMPSVRLVVASPMLKHVKLTGAGDIDIKEKVIFADLNVELSGSGDVDIEDMECGKLKAVVSGTGDMKIDNAVCSDDVTFVLSGSGDINVDASCPNLAIETSGSGDADITVSCKVIDASAIGTGNLKIKGSADVLNRKERGLASIEAKNLTVGEINLK